MGRRVLAVLALILSGLSSSNWACDDVEAKEVESTLADIDKRRLFDYKIFFVKALSTFAVLGLGVFVACKIKKKLCEGDSSTDSGQNLKKKTEPPRTIFLKNNAGKVGEVFEVSQETASAVVADQHSKGHALFWSTNSCEGWTALDMDEDIGKLFT